MADWQAIMVRDGPSVWRSAYRIVGNRADADECFQEAFLGALAVSRREVVRDWGALLCRLASVRAIDRLRERRRRGARERAAAWESVTGPPSSPSQAAEDAELADRLRSAMAAIPPKQAESFCLHCLEGWSYREIASHLSVSVDAVGVLVHRARKQIRRRLGAPLDEPGSDRAGGNAPRKEVR